MNVRQVIPRDAIPSVDDPEFGTGYDGEAGDRVVVVESEGPARAYPIRHLSYHEIVNDVVNTGDPIAVTWCPLCGSAVVYDRRHRGRALEFGVSGKLADDDLVVYDRETESEWKQSSGRCLAGEFEGDSLSVRPASVLTWEAFRRSYPNGVVLQPPGGESEAASDGDAPAPIEYDTAPYKAYRSADGFGLGVHRSGESAREWDRDDDISPKTVVLGVEADADALGFPLPRVLAAGGVVQTSVGQEDVLVVATEDSGVHGFTDPGFAVTATSSDIVGDGTTWDPGTGCSTDGRRLNRLPTRRLFAFAWQDDHGPNSFYRP